jgi:hypothetical protein
MPLLLLLLLLLLFTLHCCSRCTSPSLWRAVKMKTCLTTLPLLLLLRMRSQWGWKAC